MTKLIRQALPGYKIGVVTGPQITRMILPALAARNSNQLTTNTSISSMSVKSGEKFRRAQSFHLAVKSLFSSRVRKVR